MKNKRKKKAPAGVKRDLACIYQVQKDLSLLGSAEALLHWDLECYMPKGAFEDCAETTAHIARICHEQFTSPALWNAVRRLAKQNVFRRLPEKDKNVVKRLHKDISKARKVPSWFVEKFSKTTTRAHMAWEEAKTKKKFSIFAPHLKKIVALERKYCEFVGYKHHPYNALLDNYEEGMTVDKLKKTFGVLKPSLVMLLKNIQQSKHYGKKLLAGKTFPAEGQKQISRFVMEKMLLPADHTRLDISAHPFTINISPRDVRITTHYLENKLFDAFSSTIHEAGHALYDLGYDKKYMYTVCHTAASTGLHESQSRFWEKIVGCSPAFLKAMLPKFRKEFSTQIKGISAEEFIRASNDVRPHLIRIESDEISYCLHIILRFEIEAGLIEGSIQVENLPKIWNNKMNEMIGITPKNDAEGVLQDVHWSGGMFGYFPSYALGSIYYAQIYDAMKKDMKNIDRLIGRLEFAPILSWLRRNIHRYNNILPADEIIRRATGSGLDPESFVKYLREKYSSIYDFTGVNEEI